MRCKTCHYTLEELTGPPHRCPECGRVFDPNDPKTFDTARRLPMLSAVNVVVGVCVYALTFFMLLQSRAVRPSDLPETVWMTALLAAPVSAIVGGILIVAQTVIR